MENPHILIEQVGLFMPLVATMLTVIALLLGAHWLLIRRQPGLGNERLFPRHLAMLGLTLAGILAIALALPVSESTRNQIIALVGLLVSGVFAFSSSTIFANLLAGIMLRVTKPFNTGDFIEVADHFGRVVERGLLDTEIQTENRELVALPNTYMISHPITAIRGSGTIVSATLSLGYDIHHVKVEPLLLEAAKQCGLEESFVQIMALGDYSVTYKVSGMLVEVKSLLTSRSNLCRAVLDGLHGSDIEIVSPAFMNQRRLPEDTRMIPAMLQQAPAESIPVAEGVAFDKAEQAEQVEKEKQQLLEKIEEYSALLKDASKENGITLQAQIKEARAQLKVMQAAEEDDVEPDAG
ncbi:MAG: mechanosensitive ion channel domain-containing protein [Pseudomonadales bacterium]